MSNLLNLSNLSNINIKTDDYYTKEIEHEPLFDINNKRFVLFPIQDKELWEGYKEQEKSFWSVEEIDFSQDYKYFEKLDEDKKYVIKMILAFFASMDGIVNLNIDENLLKKITLNEAIITYRYQSMMEGIHNECYSLMIDNLIKDSKEKIHLFNSIKTIPSIKLIADWAVKWIESDISVVHKIIAFACVEGILFSGAFAIIYWLKKYEGSGHNFMPGLCKSNELISRDEGMHCEFACKIYKRIINKLSEKDVHQIIIETVDIAKNFNNESIKCKLVGLNSNLMNQYIEYVSDRLAVLLGYNKIYKSTNPFGFMETIGMMQKTNFHESRATEYKSAHIEYTTEDKLDLVINDNF